MAVESRPASESGFTLLEVLIAMALLAVLSALAYTGLNQLTNVGAYAETTTNKLIALQKAQRMMEVDLEQLAPRSIRDEYGDRIPAMMTSIDGIARIEFTRAGLRNPQGLKRSSLQRVAWAVDDRKLIRYRWDVLDRAQDSEPRRAVILENVEDVEIRLLDSENAWSTQWPQGTPGETLNAEQLASLPRAVEITMTVTDFGPLRWLFQGAR